ncbi:MAG TPA: hypothetical protein VFE62_23605, partial [Gemmataceae bacterium]|nr:hypothetical protein [Gemmataceae bacterium]
MKAPEEPATVPVAKVDLLGHFKRLVQANTRRWKTAILLEALGLSAAGLLAYLWAAFLLDNQVHLSRLSRSLAALGFLAGLGWAIAHLVKCWRAIQLTEDQVALAIERSTPGGVQNRLINAMQLARGDRLGGKELSEAVVEANCLQLQQLQLNQATQLRPAIVRLGVAGALMLFGLLFLLFDPSHFVNAASRLFMPLATIDPLYRTTLVVEPGD